MRPAQAIFDGGCFPGLEHGTKGEPGVWEGAEEVDRILFDRVTAGMFSAQLFYRLNVLHLVADDGPFVLECS